MADMQMRLLRKKIRKRNEKLKERKQKTKLTEEEEETGKKNELKRFGLGPGSVLFQTNTH